MESSLALVGTVSKLLSSPEIGLGVQHSVDFTRELQLVLLELRISLEQSDAEKRFLALKDIRQSLDNAASLAIEGSTSDDHSKLSEQHAIEDSIIRLETIEEAWRSLCAEFACSIPTNSCIPTTTSLRHLERAMIATGWCPNHVNMCRRVFGLSVLIYSSRMTRPFQRQHSDCSEMQCVAYKVEERRVTKHRRPGCTCGYIGGDPEDIKQLVDEDRIPLARVEKTDDGQLRVRIVPFETGQEFIAISHVWSHGLANASTNSLPYCQVNRLFNFVEDLGEPPHLFWIDTLCVPREPFSLRRKAIQSIRRVYEEAAKVLVLDEELLACSMTFLPYEFKFMMINLSGWMRRLWTLHEHIRARVLFFQFADGTCSDRELLSEYQQDLARPGYNGVPFHNVIASRATKLLANAAALKYESNGPTRMARMWLLLRWRHLSWPEDETILMTNMLGLSPKEADKLLRTPKRRRMQSFLTLFAEYPAELLFLQVPKLASEGQRWAPASWLHCMEHLCEQSAFVVGRETLSTSTRSGLLVTCPCIVIHSNDLTMFANGRQTFVFLKNTGSWLRVRGFASHRYLTRRRISSGCHFAICLEQSCEGNGAIRGAVVASQYTLGRQNLSSLSRARFIRNVVVTNVDANEILSRHKGGLKKSLSETLNTKGSSLDCDQDLVEGEYIARPRRWCIG